MRIKIHGGRLPPAFCLAAGAIFVLVIVSGLWWLKNDSENQRWGQIYGASVAKLAAKSAVDAALNHDLVSLQVVLQDIEQSPYVELATIRDVENNLLVQAGQVVSPHNLTQLSAHQTAIGFQQNIAGYVTVYLALPPSTSKILKAFLAAIITLTFIALLTLFNARKEVFEFINRQIDKNLQPQQPDLTAPQTDENEENPDQDPYVVRATAQVIIEIDQYTKLTRTLSAELADQIRQQLQGIAEQAISIYGGHWARSPDTTLKDGVLVAIFPSAQSEDDALRTAIFFSAVVKDAFMPDCINASLSVVVGLQDEISSLETRPLSPFAIYFSNDEDRQVLSRRINIHQFDGPWWELDGFDSAYQKLLDNEVEQILSEV